MTMPEAQWKALRRKRKVTARDMRAVLVERFPKCFMTPRSEKIPLKTGINHDILATCPDLKANDLKVALIDYCGGMRYLEAMIEGAVRIGLDGMAAGVVSAKEAESAVGRLALLRERFAKADAGRVSQSVAA